MNIDHLIRDKEIVFKALKEIDNKLIAIKPIKIYVPEYYFSSQMGIMDNIVKTCAIFAIVVDDKYYAVSKACALMELTPDGSHIVEINKEKYYEFTFLEHSVICPNLNLIRVSTLVYRIYTNIIAKGHISWFLSYEDLATLFDTASSHGNANLRADSSLLELIPSSMARQKEDKSKYYRHDPRLLDLKFNIRPTFIALRSVSYSATNTLARLAGGYFNEGLTSSLVNPSDESQTLETILRK